MGEILCISVGVLEDQSEFVLDIKKCLQRWENDTREYSLDIFTNGDDLLNSVKTKNYDVLFLDIVLNSPDAGKEESGVVIAHKLRKAGFDNILVFVTKFSEYMEKGYDVQIYRYCFKPINYDKFHECMDHAVERKLGKYFRYSFKEEYMRIPYSSIQYFSAQGHTVYIHTDKEVLKMATTIRKVLEVVPNYFVQCHRSFIANLEKVKKFKSNILFMDNNDQIFISQLALPKVRQEYLRQVHKWKD